MKRFTTALVVAAFAIAATATVALAGKATLQTFGTGVVTLTGEDSATIVNDAGEYGGVYIKSKSNSAKLVDVVFQFTSRADVTGGAPRFSLPIDDPATKGKDAGLDGYAFIDAANCGGVSGGTTLVSTQNPACQVFYGAGSWANWAAFAAANPTLHIASGYTPFIIADGAAGSYNVTDIVLR
jgi:hypothetical protein